MSGMDSLAANILRSLANFNQRFLSFAYSYQRLSDAPGWEIAIRTLLPKGIFIITEFPLTHNGFHN
jgi:hypothetical protein